MSNIVKFGGANLPSPQSLSNALRSIEADVGPVGTVIIKMDRTGHWVYGLAGLAYFWCHGLGHGLALLAGFDQLGLAEVFAKTWRLDEHLPPRHGHPHVCHCPLVGVGAGLANGLVGQHPRTCANFCERSVKSRHCNAPIDCLGSVV